ncbi:MAG: 50S ribosomal protein L32 [Phycisphaeraceae bacterium]|nr:50S ribosomal protein L32 [Phycisphaeraceae bacterium]
MPVPAFRQSRSRQGKRRSHHAISATRAVVCPNCGNPKLPHAACRSCGYVRPGLQLTKGTRDE